MTTPVHSFDTSDRENDSAVTDTSANFNAAVTDSIRDLCSIARADVPTNDDYVHPHMTHHQGISELLGYHFICDTLFSAIHDQLKENHDIRIIIDSGATSHMLPSKEYFISYNEYTGE